MVPNKKLRSLPSSPLPLAVSLPLLLVLVCRRCTADEEDLWAKSSHHRPIISGLLHQWGVDHKLNLSRVPPGGWAPPWGSGAGGAGGVLGGQLASVGPLPEAPHLDRCLAKQRLIDETDRRGLNGEDPPWADTRHPQPPWIRGADSENFAGTRRAQADLWQHQFPRDPACRSQRLLVVRWAVRKAGIGASIHLMGKAFQVAMGFDRVFVPLPRSFLRGDHEGCEEFGRRSSLSCYFAPVTAHGCEERAAEWIENIPEQFRLKEGVFTPILEPNLSPEEYEARCKAVMTKLASAEELVYIHETGGLMRFWNCWSRIVWAEDRPIIARWGTPWMEQWPGEELLGKQVLRQLSAPHVRESKWWSAQSVRFMCRWPSLYLCHLTNKIRHEAFGRLVARGMTSILDSGRSFPMDPHSGRDLTPWTDWEPYIPRPILSMHVRQGDKAVDMKVNGVRDFFNAAYWKRLDVPDLKYVWLSTEMETAIQAAKTEPGWTFFYSEGVKRQAKLGEHMWAAEASSGYEAHVGMSFANLVIASQCDQFVGTLGSNWNRLIDELRKTNGRYNAGIVTLTGYPE